MKVLKLFTLGMAFSLGCAAQNAGNFVITGEMTNPNFRFSDKPITKLYLQREVDGQQIRIDSTVVEGNKFTFKGVAPKELEMYYIVGFDNGSVPLFLESGNIQVHPFDGRFPVAAKVSGTPNNQVLFDYQTLYDTFAEKSRVRMNQTVAQLPEEIRNDEKKAYGYQRAMYWANGIYYKMDVMHFVRQNLDKEAILYVIDHNLYNVFSTRVLERQLLRAIPVKLRGTRIYKQIMNKIKAANLAVGNAAPDITAKTPDGKEVSLSDLEGKYVFLDFWASWCGPCRREIPFLKQALQLTEGKDNFVILSYSIDNKMNEWTQCIEKNQLTHKNWIHVSTLKGWSSDAVTLFNVTGVPRTVLLNPQGKVIAFDLRGEEFVAKVKNIMDGVETYE